MVRRLEPPHLAGDAVDGDELLRLALSEPRKAAHVATRLLETHPVDVTASYALQALSIAAREAGDGARALRYVRQALRVAERSGRHDRSSDVRATLGSTLALVGRSKEALDAFDRALRGTRGIHAARIRMRRGGVLQILGRYDEAYDELQRALPVLRSSGDIVYAARTLHFRAAVLAERGLHDRADQDLAEHEQLMQDAGQRLESAVARLSRGLAAHQAGDLPSALRHIDAAQEMFADIGEHDPDLELDRCAVFLSAGMPAEAYTHADGAVQILSGNTAYSNRLAEAHLMAASAGLAVGEWERAGGHAETAVRLFRRHHRHRWTLRAERLAIAARVQGGHVTSPLARAADRVARELDSIGDPESTDAHLLAGRVWLALGKVRAGREHLEAAARSRRRGAAIGRATGWLARALNAQAAGDSRTMLIACRRGLDLLDEYRMTLGATEMRARATVHGTELAAIAARHSVETGDPRRLLVWSERWRATALTSAPVRPPDDEGLAFELSTLRGVTRRIAESRAAGESTTLLEHEQSRIESAVRQRMLRTSGTGSVTAQRFDLRRLREGLGDTTLVELVEVDGVLHVVTVDQRRTVLHTVGPTAAALSELEYALFALRRIAAATSPALIRASSRSLHAAAAALEKALLGPAVDRLGNGPVLIVPSGRLHAVPWSLLTSLCEREVTVAPSATSWLRARAVTPPTHDRVTLVVGPGLETGGAEVAEVVGFYPHATLLADDAATADDVLDALNGASLAHIAAHGTFRADNALFSSLRLTDGPLTVHDLERLRHPPHRLVLSSCDSGLGAVAGADELLGLSSALIGMGSAGLLASVVQVNDAATVPLMVAVHEQLRDGATLAQALHRARMSLGTDDPVLLATGQSFIALGAA